MSSGVVYMQNVQRAAAAAAVTFSLIYFLYKYLAKIVVNSVARVALRFSKENNE